MKLYNFNTIFIEKKSPSAGASVQIPPVKLRPPSVRKISTSFKDMVVVPLVSLLLNIANGIPCLMNGSVRNFNGGYHLNALSKDRFIWSVMGYLYIYSPSTMRILRSKCGFIWREVHRTNTVHMFVSMVSFDSGALAMVVLTPTEISGEIVCYSYDGEEWFDADDDIPNLGRVGEYFIHNDYTYFNDGVSLWLIGDDHEVEVTFDSWPTNTADSQPSIMGVFVVDGEMIVANKYIKGDTEYVCVESIEADVSTNRRRFIDSKLHTKVISDGRCVLTLSTKLQTGMSIRCINKDIGISEKEDDLLYVDRVLQVVRSRSNALMSHDGKLFSYYAKTLTYFDYLDDTMYAMKLG